MKKFNVLLIFILLLTLVGCQKETDDTDIPKEPIIEEPLDDALKDLAYYQYLNDTNPVITITVKNYGVMKTQLFPEIAENTVNNYIKYVTEKGYQSSTFHRVIKNFMIQGGMSKLNYKPIFGEFDSNGFNNPLKHTRGVLSMARTTNKNSATSQFFIMHVNYPFLDGEYASFGGLISGFDVLDKIASVQTNYYDAPLSTIIIESITINLRGYEPKEVVYFG